MAPLNESPVLNGAGKQTNGTAKTETTSPSSETGIVHPKAGDDIPDLSKRLRVERSEKAFSSRAVSLISLPAGSLFARITTASITPTKAYSSVQISADKHIELNSDLLYCNHSCAPSLVFDMSKFEVRVVPERELKEGDVLTFFYPSTEWSMAQGFECNCGAKECKGYISGAGEMDEAAVRKYWLNPHIEELLDQRAKK